MKGNHNNIRVLMPVLHYPPVIGGIEAFLQNVGERVGRDIDVYMLTGRVLNAPSREQHGRLHIDRTASLFTLRDYSHSSYLYVGTLLPVLLVKTLVAIRRENITILHGHGFLSGLVCLIAHWLTKVPYIITIQSADFTIYHPEVRLNALVRLQAALERLVYRHATIAHAVSNDLCIHYKRQGRPDCVLIPNGVNTKHHHLIDENERHAVRAGLGVSDDMPMIVTVGRLEPKAAIHDLIEAMALLRQNVSNATLVIVGDGSLRHSLEAEVSRLGLTDAVIFAGQKSYEEVGPIVASADVFARTPHSEGFGIVFIEAMAAGTPVVATRVGGIPDFIEHERTGLLVSSKQSKETAEAIQRLINDTQLADTLREHALRLVDERYDWDVIAKEVGMLYNKVNTL